MHKVLEKLDILILPPNQPYLRRPFRKMNFLLSTGKDHILNKVAFFPNFVNFDLDNNEYMKRTEIEEAAKSFVENQNNGRALGNLQHDIINVITIDPHFFSFKRR